MPLFSSGRDRLLVRHISRELMHRFISIECALYKLALPEMEINIYNESNKKVYYNPVRAFCLVNKDESSMTDTEIGIDYTQNLQFKFIRDDLKEIDFVLTEGDIIKFDGSYYEVDSVDEQQYWMGRNQETLPIVVEGRSNQSFGYNISVVAQTHQTRLSQLNLVETRAGINDISRTKSFPKNL